MATLKSPVRQSSFEYFSPFNAVLSSVGVQHEKALKQAFYNTIALVFVLAGGAAGVAVYFVLDPFLKPLLWAGLCGAFLHPFKSTMTRIFRKWLASLRSSNTPLVVGAVVVPFQLLNSCSDIVGGFIARRLRLIVILTLLAPFIYGLYVFRPFLEIFSILYQASMILCVFMDYFSNTFAVWSVIIGYTIALIFWWTPSTSHVMRILSFPVWITFVNYLASIAGVYRVPLFLVIIFLTVVGFITDATGGKDQVDGSSATDVPNKRSSIIEGLSVAASVLSPITYDSDDSCTDNIDDIPKPSTERKNLNETPQASMPIDNMDGRETRLQRMRRQNKGRLDMKKKTKPKSASYPYFVALLWGILLTRVWMHAWILQLLPIPFAIYLIKLVVVWSGTWAYLKEFLISWYERLRVWSNMRKDAIMPAPIRGMAKLAMRGDQKVNSLMEKSIENLMSVFMVIGLIVGSIIVTVLLAVQVHHESVHLVTVTGNLVNDVMAKNPQLLKWISENAEFKKTLDSAVERGYILGRKWIAAKVGTFLGDSSGNTTQLQQNVLEFTDRFYHAWMGEGNYSIVNKVSNGSLGWTRSTINETATALTWGNILSWTTKLDFKVLFSVVKENLGILMSLLESLYVILKGNVTMVVNLVTMVLSLVFVSGTYVLNTGLSMVVFVTALFYLLSMSGDQYKPVEWFGQMSATGTAGLGESLFKAIRDVFGAALKMATFYGLYTWFTHTLFGINIVFIPSAIAAVAAVVPFIGTYWAAIPAVLELWLVQGEGVLAVILAICHILPISFVDTAIYSEISGGGHPYLTGLAVAGGIYCVGLEGAIIGPIVLCCLIVACQVYGSMIAETSPSSDVPTIMSAVEGERITNIRGLSEQFKKTPLQKPHTT